MPTPEQIMDAQRTIRLAKRCEQLEDKLAIVEQMADQTLDLLHRNGQSDFSRKSLIKTFKTIKELSQS